MAYTNSPLVAYTKISPNKTSPRNKPIDRVSIHCVVGQCSVETIGQVFAPTSRQASSNYGVGYDGKVGMYCEEKDRSWCTSSGANDHRAITIEVASDTKHPYAVNDKAYAATLDLVTDICRRNGKKKLLWFGDKEKTLDYNPAPDEMVLTVHRWFAAKACPGDYLYERHGAIAAEVTKRLGGTASTPAAGAGTAAPSTGTLQAGTQLTLSGVDLYASHDKKTSSGKRTGTYYVWSDEVVSGRIRITNAKNRVGVDRQVTGWIALTDAKAATGSGDTQASASLPYLVRVAVDALNVRKGPGTGYGIATTIRNKGIYTIVQEQDGWGKLKSGAGWIKLSYTTKY